MCLPTVNLHVAEGKNTSVWLPTVNFHVAEGKNTSVWLPTVNFHVAEGKNTSVWQKNTALTDITCHIDYDTSPVMRASRIESK